MLLMLLTKKRAGASRAAGCLPAGGGPGLFLVCWLQPDSPSLVGGPVHHGSLGHQEGPDIDGENKGGEYAAIASSWPLPHTPPS